MAYKHTNMQRVKQGGRIFFFFAKCFKEKKRKIKKFQLKIYIWRNKNGAKQ